MATGSGANTVFRAAAYTSIASSDDDTSLLLGPADPDKNQPVETMTRFRQQQPLSNLRLAESADNTMEDEEGFATLERERWIVRHASERGGIGKQNTIVNDASCTLLALVAASR